MTHMKTAATAAGLILLAAAVVLAGEVRRFTLIDARTGRPIGTLKDGATVDRSEVGSRLSVRADVTGDVGSVRFEVDGRTVQTESTPPYALAGDTDGNYNTWSVGPGRHTLKATPYAEGGAKGAAGKALAITFTVTGEAAGGGERPIARGKPPELEKVPPAETIKPGTVKTLGEMKKWHKVTLAFGGPAASETADPNPFTDYRLNVTFQTGDTTYMVPGYYAADGNAADSGAAAGNVWMVHFAPDETGRWTWKASFRAGPGVAVTDDPDAGEPVAPVDGKTGTLAIGSTDKTGRDFRGRGRLEYVGRHYLRFAETGEWFLKCGADAPENFLAYDDFDNTPDHGGRRKSWKPHERDWRPGDPTWRGGKGKGMIGALNYLASEGMNVFSFIPLTIHGDDKNVFPYVAEGGPFTRLDCSKLGQWEIVFEHADRLGLYLHFKTQETENEMLLDDGDVGPERRLYYRELIARFGHHLALNWNLGEENGALGKRNQSTAQRIAMTEYFWNHDPYRHLVVIHNDRMPDDLLGDVSKLTGFSLQTNRPDFGNVHRQVAEWVAKSARAGRPWVVACDEPGDASHALRPDADAGNSHEDGRKNGLWGAVMAGGAGTEWYFGYKHAQSDLTCEDWRSRDTWWDYCRYMLQFFDKNKIPFWEMACDDGASTAADDYCFAKPGEVYVVYLKKGGTMALDLSGARGTFAVGWYDPRHGGDLKPGSVRTVTGGGKRDLGAPPADPGEDWVILVRK